MSTTFLGLRTPTDEINNIVYFVCDVMHREGIPWGIPGESLATS